MKKIGNNDEFWRTEAASNNLLDEAESFEAQMDPESERPPESDARTMVSTGEHASYRAPDGAQPVPEMWMEQNPSGQQMSPEHPLPDDQQHFRQYEEHDVRDVSYPQRPVEPPPAQPLPSDMSQSPAQKRPDAPSIGADLIAVLKGLFSLDPTNALTEAGNVKNSYTWIVLAVIAIFGGAFSSAPIRGFILFPGVSRFAYGYLSGLINMLLMSAVTVGAYFLFRALKISGRDTLQILNLCFVSLLPVALMSVLYFLAGFILSSGPVSGLLTVGRALHWLITHRALNEETVPKHRASLLFFLLFVLIESMLFRLVAL